MKQQKKILGIIILASIVTISATLYQSVSAQTVPDWIRNTALWYGEGNISETEFLNAIKYLLENKIIVIEFEEEKPVKSGTANVIIPHGNYDVANSAFYIPLHLEVKTGTTVVWINDDTVPHTIQSQDAKGNVIGLFNSAPLKTGERFAHTFNEGGVYNYFCTLHPWRIGVVTVT
ncbi:MAG TPA: plastocyanin/azurin family copper-binding protein [Nitrosopumilaceae archaeon]|nr:plastocyanin/azurin family copper-binding protein [Nitrosopumilaceae archaeon]